MTKIWNGVFWGTPEHPTGTPDAVTGRLRSPHLMQASTIGLVALTVAIAVFAGPIYELCERAATELLDPAPYVQAVLP